MPAARKVWQPRFSAVRGCPWPSRRFSIRVSPDAINMGQGKRLMAVNVAHDKSEDAVAWLNGRSSLDRNPLDLVERDGLAGSVVELSRPGVLVPGDPLRVLEAAAVAQVLSDACCAEGVAAEVIG